ncbi:hypothetical protein FACS189483_04810 [Spirochaetia bacterium]|nr:hypothetical protein FACS189483_04810 [Spirochaetia bacterium]
MAIGINRLTPLEEVKNLRVKGQLKLEDFQKAFDEKAKELQIPIAFKSDQVSSGCLGMTKQDCLTIFHPDHEKGWGKVCLRLTTQGVYTLADFNWIEGFGVQHVVTNVGEAKGGIVGGILKGITAKKNSDMDNWIDALIIILKEAMEDGE